jgi:hypothetical protein
VARTGERIGAYRVLVGKDVKSVDRRLILKLYFKKWGWAWTALIWLRIGTGGGHL